MHIRGRGHEELPEEVGCEYEFLRLASGLELTAASISSNTPSQWASTSQEGISLGIVLHGHVDFGIGRRCDQQFRGSDGFILSSGEQLETAHAISGASQHHTVYVHLPDAAIDELHRSYPGSEALTRRLGKDPKLRRWKPHRASLILAEQIARCPYSGPLRRLYLEGKALELLAVIYGRATGDHTWSGPAATLSATNKERLVAARDILVTELRSPPPLDALARRVGMCTSRLTVGFRALFGVSVTEFVQEQRLDAACAALAEGKMSVSQVAYSVGYTPAHFSTLFRRKFGMPPSALLPRS